MAEETLAKMPLGPQAWADTKVTSSPSCEMMAWYDAASTFAPMLVSKCPSIRGSRSATGKCKLNPSLRTFRFSKKLFSGLNGHPSMTQTVIKKKKERAMYVLKENHKQRGGTTW